MDFATLLQYAAPVAIAALGETVVQRSGVINIGLEGTMLVGAYFGMTVSLGTGSPWLGLGAAILAGILLMAVTGAFTVSLAADQVVVGTAVNLFALGLTGTLFRARFGASGKLLSVPSVPQWHHLDAVILVLVLATPLLWWLLRGTGWGLALRAAGEYPKSVEASGFSVTRLRYAACLIGGLFGGLAGGYLALGIAGSFTENMTAGRGFMAIAMVTFGRWRPGWVFAAALLIGLAESLQFWLQAMGVNAPYQLMIALPYIVSLLVLVVVGKGTQAPAALGVPYSRES